MPTFVVIFSRHELKFQQLSQTLISRPLNCYLQLCKSKMLNFLLMSQTGVWVRSLPSSAMTSKRSSSSESLATFRLAKLSSFEQLHPPYGLPSLHFIFKQQCHITNTAAMLPRDSTLYVENNLLLSTFLILCKYCARQHAVAHTGPL